MSYLLRVFPQIWAFEPGRVPVPALDFTMGRQPFYDLVLLAFNNLAFVVVAKWNTPYSIARP